MALLKTVAGLSHPVLKRTHESSSDDEEARPYKKKYFYILEPASSTSDLSDGPESVLSIQDKSTDVAKDTSDTCSKSGDCQSNVEYEVVSLSESESFFFPFRESSDSPEDLHRLSVEDTRVEELKNTESSCNNSEEAGEPSSAYVFSPYYKHCLRCKEANSHPFFKYCLRCYRLRKDVLPERKKVRKKRQPVKLRQKLKDDLCDSGLGSSQGLSLTPDGCQPGASSFPRLDDSTSQQLTPDANRNNCNICFSRPKDGAFCHGAIVHIYACYPCSVKVYQRSGRCPGCNNKARQVSRVVQL